MSYPDAEDVGGFYATLLPQITALPAIAAARAVTVAPMADGLAGDGLEIGPARAHVQAVTPGYFAAIDIPLLEGRVLQERWAGRAAGRGGERAVGAAILAGTERTETDHVPRSMRLCAPAETVLIAVAVAGISAGPFAAHAQASRVTVPDMPGGHLSRLARRVQ